MPRKPKTKPKLYNAGAITDQGFVTLVRHTRPDSVIYYIHVNNAHNVPRLYHTPAFAHEARALVRTAHRIGMAYAVEYFQR